MLALLCSSPILLSRIDSRRYLCHRMRLAKRLLAAGYEDSEIRSMEREHDKACQRGLAVGQNTGAL